MKHIESIVLFIAISAIFVLTVILTEMRVSLGVGYVTIMINVWGLSIYNRCKK